MNERLKDYLAKRGAKPLDSSVLEKYADTMIKSTIPQIVEDIKQNEQLAAELRLSPTSTSRWKKKRD